MSRPIPLAPSLASTSARALSQPLTTFLSMLTTTETEIKSTVPITISRFLRLKMMSVTATMRSQVATMMRDDGRAMEVVGDDGEYSRPESLPADVDELDDWDTHLNALSLAYNTTPHTATKFPPSFLLNGFTPRTVSTLLGIPTKDGSPIFKFEDGLATTLEYQAELIRRHILDGLNASLYPDRHTLRDIPNTALERVQLASPPLFTSAMTRILHQPYPKTLLIHFFTSAQNDITATLKWLEELKYRCTFSHLNQEWKWNGISDLHSAGYVYSMEKAHEFIQDITSQNTVLTHVAQAQHWPNLAAHANKVLNKLKARMAEWDEEHGTVIDVDGDSGNPRSYNFTSLLSIGVSNNPSPRVHPHPSTSVAAAATTANTSNTPIPSTSTPIPTSADTMNTPSRRRRNRHRHRNTARRSQPFRPGTHHNPHPNTNEEPSITINGRTPFQPCN
ncbi:hypothetical protein SISSUDRAFT_1067816 [Sistotremastrum suecicum HHB10207 ss-3]|uniref:Uncharacterized protein n=1 Tax=Sistotremastrum suecicum HHB10207 ss-3 TaxID=1314776 RepID=A0A165WNN0_9AGAM|nr:hypothetical protein SISSUDRAFT_1067816 [Sistotremastrum suecicum HHB10207 ss-3]